jgi:hypothetical protein
MFSSYSVFFLPFSLSLNAEIEREKGIEGERKRGREREGGREGRGSNVGTE